MKKDAIYDVIVIGSGPAGCAAAITVARHGLSVLVVAGKKSSFDFTESFHPGIESLLVQLNCFESIGESLRGEYVGISNTLSPALFNPESGPNWNGFHVRRDIFDDQLRKITTNHGVAIIKQADVHEIDINFNEVSIVTLSTNEKFSCRYLVDASGKKAIIGRLLNLRQTYYSQPFVCWSGRVRGIETSHYLYNNKLAYFNSSRSGWSWLAPEASGHCSYTCLALKGREKFYLPESLAAFESVGKQRRENTRWRKFDTVCYPGVILCGDAAGLLDPAAGQGVLNALYSGIRAGEVCAGTLSRPELEDRLLGSYNTWFNKFFQAKITQLNGYYNTIELQTDKTF